MTSDINIILAFGAWFVFCIALAFTLGWIMQVVTFIMHAYHDRSYVIGPQYVLVTALLWSIFGFLIS